MKILTFFSKCWAASNAYRNVIENKNKRCLCIARKEKAMKIKRLIDTSGHYRCFFYHFLIFHWLSIGPWIDIEMAPARFNISRAILLSIELMEWMLYWMYQKHPKIVVSIMGLIKLVCGSRKLYGLTNEEVEKNG